jgi:hypothetical protein
VKFIKLPLIAITKPDFSLRPSYVADSFEYNDTLSSAIAIGVLPGPSEQVPCGLQGTHPHNWIFSFQTFDNESRNIIFCEMLTHLSKSRHMPRVDIQ